MQLSTEALGRSAAPESLEPLRAAVEAAGSSVSLPYVLHQVRLLPHVHGSLALAWTQHRVWCSKSSAAG